MDSFEAFCTFSLNTAVRTGCRQYVGFFGDINIDTGDEVKHYEILDKRKIYSKAFRKAEKAVFCNPADSSLFDALVESGYEFGKIGFFMMTDIGSNDCFVNVMKILGENVCDGTAVCFTYENIDCFKLEMLAEGFGFHIYEHINADKNNYALDGKGRFFCLAVKK